MERRSLSLRPCLLWTVLATVSVAALSSSASSTALAASTSDASPAGGAAVTQEELRLDLGVLFDVGPVFEDRNSDGVVDFVDAAVVLGDSPSAREVAAAADVSARLGHETMAMDIPVATTPTTAEVAVLVGADALERVGLAAEDLGITSLSEGEGIVHVSRSADGPYLAISGADDAGTRAAAEAFAGRLPGVWDPDDATVGMVAEEVAAFLETVGVMVEAARVPTIRVREGAEAFEAVVVEVEVGSEAEVESAREALEDLVDARGTAPTGDAELSYPGTTAVEVEVSGAGARSRVTVPGQEASEEPAPIPGRPGSGAQGTLDLSSLYTNDGLLGDSNADRIPDRVDALLSPSGAGAEGTVDVAARLGLESAGIVIPAARAPEAIDDPAREPSLVLVGTRHPLIDDLVDEGRLDPTGLEPGQGLVQVVPAAFGDRSAVVVTGTDQAGLDRALEQVADRFPHVWDRGKDRTTLEGVEEEAWRFLSARSPAGQAATALYRLRHLAADVADKDMESAHVKVFVEDAADGLAELVRQEAETRFDVDSLEVTVEDLDVQEAETVFEQEFEVESEVAEFWEVFRSDVLPAVESGRAMSVEVRLSESPEIRQRIARQAREELVEAGAAAPGTEVTVLSAYKQGYSWLYDVVRPRLEDEAVDRLSIRVAEAGPPEDWQHQAMYTPLRWLMEVFPIDEVLANETALTLDQIELEQTPVDAPTYEVVASDAGGRELFRETFEPRYVLRQYFDVFPGYEKVRVTTGGVTATVGDRRVVDRRIATDYERFWDRFQTDTLQRIHDYVMEMAEGKPDADDAPHFGELRVDLSLSEPHYKIGVDQEQISPLESVHEEIYFGVLHFFDVIGRFAGDEGLEYPGRVIPIMRPKNDGGPGRAQISFTGFGAPRSSVKVEFTETSGEEDDEALDLVRFDLEPVRALGAVVRDGSPGIERLDLRVKVDSETDDRAQLIETWSRDTVDRSIMSAEQITELVGFLGRMREAGLYRDALAFHDLDTIRVAAGWQEEVSAESRRVATLEANGEPPVYPDITDRLPPGWSHEGEPLVQWETPIPPSDAYDVLARMSTFPEASVYKLAESYLGKEIWAMDLMPPLEASHWSHAKATTLKPTIVFSGREHANEVSSTSHILRLAELLLTADEYRAKLDDVNVVIHPVTNPDGAQLAYDLYEITPDFMLHAGYLGALGVGVQSGYFEPDPIYPESRTRPELWRTWLPDTYFSPHGYPHHEWVQVFSEYAAWVRNRVPGGRAWWGMRGWYFSIRYVEDPDFPRHAEAARDARDLIIDYVNRDPRVRALNRRAYDRYRRWGSAFDSDTFRLDIENGVNAYRPIKGSKADEASGFLDPRVSIYGAGTEAPDETAYGPWMELVATAGLQFDLANLDYLVQGDHVVERHASSFLGGVHLRLHRPRPPEHREEDPSSR